MLLIDTKERTEHPDPAAELAAAARAERRRQRLRDAGLGLGIVSILAGIVLAIVLFPRLDDDDPAASSAAPAAAAADTPTAAEAKGIDFEPFEWVSPDLPATPAGPVKEFKVDVYEHVTKVHDDLAPTEVWSYAINGVEHRGTGASEPMVVEVGDHVKINLINGSNEKMHVRMPHSIDYHSSEVDPGTAFATIPPGGKHTFEFTAEHPGVFMYHCATDPVLHHTAAGMVGAMIVKPKDLPPVDRELWVTQQEFYIGKPGGVADLEKAKAGEASAITFNGYADQYANKPIQVKQGEKIRMYVMNAGPSKWSAFHVIGTVFDRTVIEGTEGHDVQTVNLAPSQGGWVEFTLAEEGTYPFVTHAFADMVKGAKGVLVTENPPKGGGHH